VAVAKANFGSSFTGHRVMVDECDRW